MGLEAWKAQSEFSVDLSSGVSVRARYLDMDNVLMTGVFDTAVLASLEELGPQDPPSSAQIVEGLRYKREVVKLHLLAVDGEDVTLTDADYDALPPIDREELYGYIRRTLAVPKAEAPS